MIPVHRSNVDSGHTLLETIAEEKDDYGNLNQL